MNDVRYQIENLQRRLDKLEGKPYTTQTCETCRFVFRGGSEAQPEGWCSIGQSFDKDSFLIKQSACKRWVDKQG